MLEFTPTKWKEYKLIFIPKPGKTSYKLANSWRPISLTNYILKGLERLRAWNMDEAGKDHPVHKYEHGFRTDRNTDTDLSTFFVFQGFSHINYKNIQVTHEGSQP